MKANATRFLTFLNVAKQFIIPIYQRNYSWDEKQCEQLWEDIMRVGNNDSIQVHFIGSIVYVQGGHGTLTLDAPLLVIDGQQRLTTLSILLEALARAIGEEEPIDGFSAIKIRHSYLSNYLEKDDRHFKLLLSDTDRETLKALIRGTELPQDHSLRIKENFEYFSERIADKSTSIAKVCTGLAKLMIVDIALERDQDNPQLIFESMNSTGKELSEADLIRNYILMGLQPELQSEIYRDLWRPMELDFGQEAYGDQFDDFMRHYLTIKMGDIPKLSEVYEAFKEYSAKFFTDGGHVRDLVKDIRRYSRYFVAMALGSETNKTLKNHFFDLFLDMKYSVAYPFLMVVYSDFEDGQITEKEFAELITLVESYVFRRSITQIPTNSMNKTFAELAQRIDRENYLNSVKAYFATLKNYRRFPSDEEFQAAIVQKDVYNYALNKYLLRKIENHGKKELISVENYSIEHVMPQNPSLSKEWQADLGANWREIQERYLHTLGNLTLTGYNSEYSDKPFSDKKSIEKGFNNSPLTLNASIKNKESWNEDAILSRGRELATKSLKIWQGLDISDEEIKKFQREERKSSKDSVYSLEDHEYLNRPHVRELFEAFRLAVLAIDPEVTETILSKWIAYKADTNFVDVIPKAKGLRLSINMKYPEIEDPKGMTQDITNKGRWGNGDVSVNFRNLEELPDIITLVRQSYNKQIYQDLHLIVLSYIGIGTIK